MADEERTFSPNETDTNRGREQGLGVGQRELDLQGEPAASDNPQEDWGEPTDGGAAYGANHARRGEKSDAERSQGIKTVRANKNIVSNRHA